MMKQKEKIYKCNWCKKKMPEYRASELCPKCEQIVRAEQEDGYECNL